MTTTTTFIHTYRRFTTRKALFVVGVLLMATGVILYAGGGREAATSLLSDPAASNPFMASDSGSEITMSGAELELTDEELATDINLEELAEEPASSFMSEPAAEDIVAAPAVVPVTASAATLPTIPKTTTVESTVPETTVAEPAETVHAAAPYHETFLKPLPQPPTEAAVSAQAAPTRNSKSGLPIEATATVALVLTGAVAYWKRR